MPVLKEQREVGLRARKESEAWACVFWSRSKTEQYAGFLPLNWTYVLDLKAPRLLRMSLNRAGDQSEPLSLHTCDFVVIHTHILNKIPSSENNSLFHLLGKRSLLWQVICSLPYMCHNAVLTAIYIVRHVETDAQMHSQTLACTRLILAKSKHFQSYLYFSSPPPLLSTTFYLRTLTISSPAAHSLLSTEAMISILPRRDQRLRGAVMNLRFNTL